MKMSTNVRGRFHKVPLSSSDTRAFPHVRDATEKRHQLRQPEKTDFPQHFPPRLQTSF